MAKKENLKDRARRLNPQLQAANEQIDAALVESGFSGPLVELTEDMIPEEQEMELYAGYLKGGYSGDIAAKKAKKTLALIDRIFGKNK